MTAAIPESREVPEQHVIDYAMGYTYLPVGSFFWFECARGLQEHGVNLTDPFTTAAVCSVALASKLCLPVPSSALALLTGVTA